MKKNKKSLSDQVLQNIQKRHLRPIPRWEFLVKNYLLWLLYLLSIFIGGLAFSTLIYMFKSNDWDLYYFPYFWLLSLLLFIAFAYFIFSKTKKAYRLELPKIILFALFLSLALGSLLSLFNLGQKFDSLLAKDLPLYRRVAPMKTQVWTNSSAGRLSGTITQIISPNSFELTDFSGNQWTIDIQKAIIRPSIDISLGREIKITGLLQGDIFVANEIKPWSGRLSN